MTTYTAKPQDIEKKWVHDRFQPVSRVSRFDLFGLSGAGDVKYKGSPTVDKKVSGAGSISAMGE